MMSWARASCRRCALINLAPPSIAGIWHLVVVWTDAVVQAEPLIYASEASAEACWWWSVCLSVRVLRRQARQVLIIHSTTGASAYSDETFHYPQRDASRVIRESVGLHVLVHVSRGIAGHDVSSRHRRLSATRLQFTPSNGQIHSYSPDWRPTFVLTR
jgi:hypothetical protein